MKNTEIDVLLVGGGIMSATLGSLLQQLDPNLLIVMVERLPEVAMESSHALNNAGTGHAGYCELNYTPEAEDGAISIKRALEINANFEISLQFWSHLVKKKVIPVPQRFINKTPHLSFVWGKKNVDFLQRRHALLSQHHLFADMQYSESFSQLKTWMPLIMAHRAENEKIAATYVEYGTDVDFGSLAKCMIESLEREQNFQLMTNTVVRSFKKMNDIWRVGIYNKLDRQHHTLRAKHVFLGAGGAALPLLQKSAITEGDGYGGFPVSGQWLICRKPEIVAQHQSKVYGKAALGAPPMSVPHLDARMIDGNPVLLFGPFAGFTTKFLKHGSSLDLVKSIKTNNIKSMLGAGKGNMDLTKYLVNEAFQKHEQRVAALRDFLPQASAKDWKLATAGQRVQIIKRCEQNWGKLEFGTDIVASSDGSMSALLGASPGASVSVNAMLQVIEKCFPSKLPQWRHKLQEMIPSYGHSLIHNQLLLERVRKANLKTLELE